MINKITLPMYNIYLIKVPKVRNCLEKNIYHILCYPCMPLGERVCLLPEVGGRGGPGGGQVEKSAPPPDHRGGCSVLHKY